LKSVKCDRAQYSTHAWWCDHLTRLVFGVTLKVAESEPHKYHGKAFTELIWFSDCCGAIGPVTSAKLFKDFTFYEDKAQQVQESRFFELYRNWTLAFSITQHDGSVVFG